MLMMARRQILPAIMKYSAELAGEAAQIRAFSTELTVAPQERLLQKLTAGAKRLSDAIAALEACMAGGGRGHDALEHARYQHDIVIPAMNAVREAADSMEPLLDKEHQPFPTYADLLFYD